MIQVFRNNQFDARATERAARWFGVKPADAAAKFQYCYGIDVDTVLFSACPTPDVRDAMSQGIFNTPQICVDDDQDRGTLLAELLGAELVDHIDWKERFMVDGCCILSNWSLSDSERQIIKDTLMPRIHVAGDYKLTKELANELDWLPAVNEQRYITSFNGTAVGHSKRLTNVELEAISNYLDILKVNVVMDGRFVFSVAHDLTINVRVNGFCDTYITSKLAKKLGCSVSPKAQMYSYGYDLVVTTSRHLHDLEFGIVSNIIRLWKDKSKAQQRFEDAL